MLVLGIDAATKVATVGLSSEDKLIGENYLHVESNHSENLMPLIDQLISSCGVAKEDITGVAVSTGPGSFTGLRIAMSIAKGLAQTLEIPIVGIPTLDGLAHKMMGFNGVICPILDARKGEVYTCLYSGTTDTLEKTSSYMAVSIEELANMMEPIDKPIYFLGDAIPEFKEKILALLNHKEIYFSPQPNSMPSGGQIAWLGKNLILKEEVDDLHKLTPMYLRESEAQVKLEQASKE
ncbi:tRNA threonylcarbamoyladenosine biosynthesis protein TsaB [Desulfitispora alkaliphila]|uniref:tRNA (adenosine(37)-N6)-threonylcarbamoyltransferase complex dimerization subunit type 1 TsaB n=1 Tax=Desulfitispora alkaliphila TaxID=622674 RepID=UPI003D1DD956